MVNIMAKRLVYGVGINDAGYITERVVNGIRVECQFYARWRNMLNRCYCKSFLERRPSYAGATVCYEWLTFSNFKAWMEKQNWKGRQLDKDILVKGNKVYSPETCVFVDGMTNSFNLDCMSARGLYPLGVHLNKQTSKFTSQCCNPFTKKNEHLGRFSNIDQAHEAWRKRKHELACQLADMQDDQRVAEALRTRYLTSQ